MPNDIRNDRINPDFRTLALVLALVMTAALATAIFALFSGNMALVNKLPIIMLTTLVILAVLEHWFMVLPVSSGAPWRWAIPQREHVRPDNRGKDLGCVKQPLG